MDLDVGTELGGSGLGRENHNKNIFYDIKNVLSIRVKTSKMLWVPCRLKTKSEARGKGL